MRVLETGQDIRALQENDWQYVDSRAGIVTSDSIGDAYVIFEVAERWTGTGWISVRGRVVEMVLDNFVMLWQLTDNQVEIARGFRDGCAMTLEPVKLNIGNGNRVVPIDIRSRATVQEPEPEPQEARQTTLQSELNALRRDEHGNYPGFGFNIGMSDEMIALGYGELVPDEPVLQEEEFEFPSTYPNDFMCPIMHAIMTDPVILAGSGQTYERTAIEQWFRMGRRSCPTTKINLSKAAARQLISNRALKNVIEDFLKEWRAARGTSETKKKAEKKK